MRITESRMMQVAGAALNDRRAAVASAADQLSSGVRVRRASDDPAAYAEGARARVALIEDTAYKSTIAEAQGRLSATDMHLASLNANIQRAIELGVQASNDSSNGFRAAAGAEVAQMRETVLQSLNAKGPDGEYLFSSFANGTAPFDPVTGLYTDGTAIRSVTVGPGFNIGGSVPGNRLASSGGPGYVDIVKVLDDLKTALMADDRAATTAQLDNLQQAHQQVSLARSEAGAYVSALNLAEDARSDLHQSLTELTNRTIATDPVQAATDLASAQTALTAAQLTAQQIMNLVTSLGK